MPQHPGDRAWVRVLASLGSVGRRQWILTVYPLVLCLLPPPQFKLPKEYSWPEKKLKVSILPDVVFDSPLH